MADNSNSGSIGCGGLGIGNVIAGILSWCTWHSVGWTILHLIFGWLYVFYWLYEYWGHVTLKW